ncbi:hypothetical protein QA640_46065 (plasmid) [Bradyrhizobium sp. CB82]|uniref:Mom family adenine methylcarbamoylation protein n=1 Tax=Bradyrhizobium sp. CB82 TaxID=3039159 RepID=UPI0024B03C10|nr:hypothetical protein [Bradyrhizobium sp. CB82]WFU45404.1 hypothetical protein QA640_46065 [Bradyrhizobium sp. CB82]
MDKSNIQVLVRETPWNGLLELNRLAFSEALPRNSESRALSIALRMIKKHYPHIVGDLVRRWIPVRRRHDLSRSGLRAHRHQGEQEFCCGCPTAPFRTR